MAGSESGGERVMTALHPGQLWVLRVRGAIASLFPLVAALVADMGPLRVTAVQPGLVPTVVAALMMIGLLVLPARRYRAWGYHEGEDELHIRRGLLVRVRTIVPFGRVQHIDVAQGPVERLFGVATLILHTAGTRGSAVALPGLGPDEAEAMRDRIRYKIRQELA